MGLSFLLRTTCTRGELMFLGSWHKEPGAGPDSSPRHLCSDGAGLRGKSPTMARGGRGRNAQQGLAEVERTPGGAWGKGFCVSPHHPKT